MEKQLVKTRNQIPFYHRKVARSGGSRYIAIGKMLPEDWLIVKIQVLKLEGRVCVLQISRLD